MIIKFLQRTASLLIMFCAMPLMAATLATNPTSVNYQAGSGVFLNVSWEITTVGNGGGTAISSVGTFTLSPDPSTAIATRNTTLSASSPPAGTISIGEFFQLPASVENYIQQNTPATIYYYRDFIAGAEGTTPPAFLQINITYPQPPATGGAGSGGTLLPNTESVLTLSRIALRFSDNSIAKLIPPGAGLSAVAEINYSGTGLLDAVWEIADPSSTRGGAPFFIPVKVVRQYLGVGGRIYLQSPALPTRRSGDYLLRLSIRQPAGNLSVPVLRYTVTPSADSVQDSRLPPVKLLSPAPGALLTEQVQFSWRSVKGAKAYQLELYPAPDNGSQPDDASVSDDIPASGILVPGNRTAIGLGALSRSHLQHGKTYYWRVLAIGANGKLLSRSLLREIRAP